MTNGRNSMSSILRGLLGIPLVLLAASPVWAASNVLAWTDNSTNELNFNIERKAEACTGTLPFAALASVGVNVTTYTDSAVIEGTTYCYRVNASNSAGVSAYSNTASRTGPFSVPAVPTGLGVT